MNELPLTIAAGALVFFGWLLTVAEMVGCATFTVWPFRFGPVLARRVLPGLSIGVRAAERATTATAKFLVREDRTVLLRARYSWGVFFTFGNPLLLRGQLDLASTQPSLVLRGSWGICLLVASIVMMTLVLSANAATVALVITIVLARMVVDWRRLNVASGEVARALARSPSHPG